MFAITPRLVTLDTKLRKGEEYAQEILEIKRRQCLNEEMIKRLEEVMGS
jgi:hypothetical protein